MFKNFFSNSMAGLLVLFVLDLVMTAFHAPLVASVLGSGATMIHVEFERLFGSAVETVPVYSGHILLLMIVTALLFAVSKRARSDLWV